MHASKRGHSPVEELVSEHHNASFVEIVKIDGKQYAGTICVCAQPMRDNVTM